MGKLELSDFIKFIKEEYGITATVDKDAEPDRFEDLFGDMILGITPEEEDTEK